jgi:PAS domain S-box-containing protein
MAKSIKKFLEEAKKLIKENKDLQQQLREAKESFAAIKAGNIDALVIADKKVLKVFTEHTADKTYRFLVEKMNEGAVTISEDGTILYCNSYFAKMVKVPLQKIPGTKFKNFIDDPSNERFETLLKQGGDIVIKEEVCIKTKKGKAIPALISANNLLLNYNSILSIIITDLTIQNKNQEELKQRTRQLEEKNIELENANKDLTSFTYISSHDLQEPLRKIQNFVTCILLDDEKNLSESGKRYFQRMRETANRMQALIEDLLTYSRAKGSDRKFEKTNLNKIVDEVKKDFAEIIREKKATIQVNALCEISVIKFQFPQLIHNLISNSLKFSKRTPHIVISSEVVASSELNNEDLSPKMDYCHITYTDDGIGFDPKYSERIFEVFQRLHNQEEYKGTGMGLAICKRIIENHDGIITATGKLNEGSRFDIYIPCR